jgi:hypothetical protein
MSGDIYQEISIESKQVLEWRARLATGTSQLALQAAEKGKYQLSQIGWGDTCVQKREDVDFLVGDFPIRRHTVRSFHGDMVYGSLPICLEGTDTLGCGVLDFPNHWAVYDENGREKRG